MRILILADHFGTGGGAGAIAKIMADEMASRHEVRVLASHAPESLSAPNYRLDVYDLDYSLFWRNYVGLYHPKAIKILRNHLAEFRPEAVYIHNLHTYWSYACLRVLHDQKIKSILIFHDVSAFTPYVKLCGIKPGNYHYPWYRHLRDAKFAYNPLRNSRICRYLKFATATVAVSSELAKALSQNGIRAHEVIRNGLPSGSGKAVPEPSSENLIFFAGRLSRSKGVFKVVEYLRVLKNKFQLSPIVLVAGRKGIITDKMQEYAKHQGVASQLRFLGYAVNYEYEQALARARVAIVPSICFDSLPTVALEAMRARKPVVVTNLGGAQEMVDEGLTGFIVDPFDTDLFSEKIAALLADQNLAARMGEAGFGKYQKEFAVDQMVKKYLDLLN